MSAFDSDDEEDLYDGPILDEETIRRIEVDLLAAIGREHEAVTGDPVVVASYMVVAQVVDEAGEASMMWATTDRMSSQAMLGHAHWLLKRVDEAT